MSSYPFISLLAVDADLRHTVQQLEEARCWDLGLGVVRCVGGGSAERCSTGDDGWDDPARETSVMWDIHQSFSHLCWFTLGPFSFFRDWCCFLANSCVFTFCNSLSTVVLIKSGGDRHWHWFAVHFDSRSILLCTSMNSTCYKNMKRDRKWSLESIVNSSNDTWQPSPLTWTPSWSEVPPVAPSNLQTCMKRSWSRRWRIGRNHSRPRTRWPSSGPFGTERLAGPRTGPQSSSPSPGRRWSGCCLKPRRKSANKGLGLKYQRLYINSYVFLMCGENCQEE